VPAHRYGSAVYNPAHFVVFAGFSFVYLRELITLSRGFGFALIAAGAFFVCHKW
jgi:uncharacterized protein (DUF486 family)